MYPEALKYIKISIKSDPKYAKAYYRKGMIEKELKDFENAE